MKKIAILISMTALMAPAVRAQDYIDDFSGNGNPISLSMGENWNASARVNAGDNSLKLNTFGLIQLKAQNKEFPSINRRDNRMDEEDFTNSGEHVRLTDDYNFHFLGAGLGLKAKTEDGLGTLFSKGQVTPSTQFGGYLIWKSVKIKEDTHRHTIVVSPFANVSYASYQMIPSDSGYVNKYDTAVTTWNIGISAFRQAYIGKSQFVIGLSYTFSRKNNYSDLDKVELKEGYTWQNPGNPQQTQVTTINDNGYVYGKGTLKAYENHNLKAYFTLLPNAFDKRLAFIFYPSVDFNSQYDDPAMNFGLGIHFMERDNPGLSMAGINFEWNDTNNSKGKDQPFMKRSFRVSISYALNVITLIKKK